MQDYYNFLMEIRYNDVHVLCGGYEVCKYVKEVVDRCNGGSVSKTYFYNPIFPFLHDERILGCDGHPNAAGQRLIAASVVQAISYQTYSGDLCHHYPRHHIGSIWGVNKEDKNLSYHCSDNYYHYEYDTFIISGVKYFPRTAEYNYSLLVVDRELCPDNLTLKPGLQDCLSSGSILSNCETSKTLLTIGGKDLPDGAYDLNSTEDAESFADDLWNTYFDGKASYRPFYDNRLDGINLDIRQGSGLQYYSTLVNKLLQMYNETHHYTSDFIIAETTNSCILENEQFLPGINPDRMIVRFMDTDGGECDIASPSFLKNVEVWFNYSATVNIPFELLVPTNHSYTLPYDLMFGVNDLIKKYGKESFGGVVLDEGFNDDAIGYARAFNTLFKW